MNPNTIVRAATRMTGAVLALVPLNVIAQPPNETSPLGMNLSAPLHSSDVSFANLMHLTDGFLRASDSEPITENLDGNGWPTSITEPVLVRLMGWEGEWGAYCPAGDYVLLYEGEGTIEVINATEQSRTVDGNTTRVVYSYTPPPPGTISGVELHLTETDPNGTGNYLRDIRFLLPGTEATYQTNPFNPRFLEQWSKYKAFRHVQTLQIWPFIENDEFDQPILDPSHYPGLEVDWADRKPVTDFRWGTGWPLEVVVAFHNELQADCYLNVSHTATDDTIEQMAIFFRDNLDPGLTLLVEYANESWNDWSHTYHWHESLGRAAGVGSIPPETNDPRVISLRYHTQRAVRTMQTFERIFSAAGRADNLVHVFGGSELAYFYSVNEPDHEGVLWLEVDGRPAATYFDAWAVTSYVGGALGFEFQHVVRNWTVDDLFTYINTGEQPPGDMVTIPEENGAKIGTLASTLHALNEMNDLAEEFGMHLLVYEGGPHFVVAPYNPTLDQGVPPSDFAAVDNLFSLAAQDSRLGPLMTELLDGAREAGVKLHIMFNSCEVPGFSVWSKFGFLPHIYENGANYPKYASTDAWIDANPVWWTSLQRGAPGAQIDTWQAY